MNCNLSGLFPLYQRFDPLVPVWCVTPHVGRTIHRFFDTSPFSPSGRFLGLTRLPFEDRLPSPGDVAEIVLVDLVTGRENVVAETRAWDTQLGAQVQWGKNDKQLFFNDLDIGTWKAFGVLLDPFSGTRKLLDGTVYMVSPNAEYAASPCLLRTSAILPGYGIIVPKERVPRNRGASADDGIYVTNILSGKSSLRVSIKEIFEATGPYLSPREYAAGDFYCLHVKWNPQGDRLMSILNWIPWQAERPMRSQVITMKADGSNMRVAISASEWDKGGHHPNWCPDGESLIMNLQAHNKLLPTTFPRLFKRLRASALKTFNLRAGQLRFIRAHYDGDGYEVLADRVQGSGHPTMHPSGRYIVTDSYINEPIAFGDGTVPIRLIDLDRGSETNLLRIKTEPAYRGPRGELRVDPHPAWDREYQRLALNACVDGTRRVYVADLTNILT